MLSKALLPIAAVVFASLLSVAYGQEYPFNPGFTCAANAACQYQLYEYRPRGQSVVVPGCDYDGSLRSGYVQETDSITTKTLVLLVAGQSISANYVNSTDDPADARAQFLNPYNSVRYRIKDPVLGASGCETSYQGSYLSRLAEELVSDPNGNYNSGTAFARVIVIDASIGSTSIADWGPYGMFEHRLLSEWRMAVALGWNSNSNITFAVLWDQGQEDAMISTATMTWKNDYAAIQQQMYGIGFPTGSYWWVPVDTMLAGYPNTMIATAQTDVVGTGTYYTTKSADNFDNNIGTGDRYDGTHFTGAGAVAAAGLVAAKMEAVY